MASILSRLIQFLYPLRKRINKIMPQGSMHSPETKTDSSSSIYAIKVRSIDGGTIDLGRFRGKKMLVVNTASECGFTPQYAGLQKLHERYSDRISVIGFPSNNFGAQEPGTEKEIQTFCQKNYGVTFLLAAKSDVAGPQQNEMFRWLTKKELNGWNNRDPNWNFCKYLVDEHGKLVHFFSAKLDPLDAKIVYAIETS